MFKIDKYFDSDSFPVRTEHLRLSPNHEIDHQRNSSSTEWTGFISSQPVKIIQKGRDTGSLDDFDFIVYPAQYDYIKPTIVDMIDKYVKKMTN